MSTTYVLSVIGIAISFLFGICGIYLAVRKRKYPGRIAFIEEYAICLFSEVTGNLSGLSILYNNVPISHNLVLLKGRLANIGSKDISPEMVSQPLRASLPDGYQWIEVKIVESSPDVQTTASILNATTLEFNLGVFRRNEHVLFEALAEIPISSDKNVKPAAEIEKHLSWYHRIIETSAVKIYIIPHLYNIKGGLYYRWLRVLLGPIAGLFLIGVVFFGGDMGTPKNIYYNIIGSNGKEIMVELKPNYKGASTISGVDSDFIESLPIESLNAKYNWEIVIVRDVGGTIVEAFLLMLIAIYIISTTIVYCSEELKYREYRRLIYRKTGENPNVLPGPEEA